MKKINENLSEIFEIESIPEKKKDNPVQVVVEEKDEVTSDASFARTNIRELITNGNIAAKQLAAVADQSEQPRAYEVLATMIKNLGDLNKDLLELQKRKKDLSVKEENKNNVNIDKAVFVGSTKDLVKMIKSEK